MCDILASGAASAPPVHSSQDRGLTPLRSPVSFVVARAIHTKKVHPPEAYAGQFLGGFWEA